MTTSRGPRQPEQEVVGPFPPPVLSQAPPELALGNSWARKSLSMVCSGSNALFLETQLWLGAPGFVAGGPQPWVLILALQLPWTEALAKLLPCLDLFPLCHMR